ncbi:MAG: peroxidase family protein [Cypionkella sp.]
MTNLASLHGAGYRLVLRPPSASDDLRRQADLFGPDGIANNSKDPIVLDLVESDRGRSLSISDDAAARIGGLIASPGIADASREFLTDLFRSTPVRIYERTTEPAPVADEAMLGRLGKLGDALLVDYDFAPPPPLPKLMKKTPAAFTYLGQFLAHEMTVWNPTGSKDPPKTPIPVDSSIDLKTIFLQPFGFPPKLPGHVHEVEGLALGETIADLGKGFPGAGLDDLPRLCDGSALLFEPRNDQNLALSQTHVVITRFAQAALRILQEAGANDQKIRKTVIRHFQSVVLQDYLPRLVNKETWDDVMTHGRVWVAPSREKGNLHPFYVSPEFSGAVFRFGHTMVRDVYMPWNTVDPNDEVPFAFASDLLQMTFDGGKLTQGQLLQKWATDWRHMLGLNAIAPIKATQVGTALSRQLFCLPADLFQKSDLDTPCPGEEPGHLNLARRTLVGGGQLGLKTGQTLAREVERELIDAGSPCRVPILQPDQLTIPDNAKATEVMLEGEVGQRFVDDTPLWLYVLREAAVYGDGNQLGPLGGRIVAETLSAAVEASGTGMIVDGIRKPFRPDPSLGGKFKYRFDYSDLVSLALQV